MIVIVQTSEVHKATVKCGTIVRLGHISSIAQDLIARITRILLLSYFHYVITQEHGGMHKEQWNTPILTIIGLEHEKKPKINTPTPRAHFYLDETADHISLGYRCHPSLI